MWIRFALLAVLLAPLASGQAVPFLFRVQQDNNVFAVANGASLSLGAPAIGKSASLKISATYLGLTSATFTRLPEIFGSQDFSATAQGPGGSSLLGLTLKPNESVTLDVSYVAATSTRTLAQVDFPFTEAPLPPATIAQTGLILFGLVGTSPELSVSYALEADSNISPVPPGGSILFPDTVVNATSTALLIVTNRGSAPGELKSITVSGSSAFQLTALPLLPGFLASAADVRLGLRYRPRQVGSDSGSLQITFGETTYTATLQGTATGSLLTYELVQDESAQPILPNQLLTVPDTAVGERSTLTIRVRSAGIVDAVISAFSVSGTAFQLGDVPFTPLTLASGDSRTFTVVFAPTQPGRVTGRLRVGADSFDLAGTGIGARLVYSYRTSAGTTTVLPGATVIFSPLQTGQTAAIEFSVQNTGTAPATLSSIAVAELRSPFSVANLPALPLSLAQDATVRFTVRFAPVASGFSTGTLRVDAQSFGLSGFADPPPALPAYSFQGASGSQQPLQQPSVGLTLGSSYPLPLTGTLTMTIEPEAFTPDPAVQFSTGGRTVSFTIPANTTRAQFANGSNEIRLQTGTVAGTIVLTPSFATQAGFDLTPETPQSLRLTVPPGPPRLLAAQVTSITATGFVVQLTGYATTRTLSKLDFQFTAAPNINVTGTTVSINVELIAETWFRGATSLNFGGQFTVALPFTLTATGTTVQSPLEVLASFTATLSNERGTSNSLTTPIR